MNENKSIIYQQIVQETKTIFGDRVVCLLSYGSTENGRDNNLSDIDLFLLLDKYDFTDLQKVREIITIAPTIDISLQYQDELPKLPHLYHDRNKSCLSLTYLSSATPLIGRNIFVNVLNNLSDAQLKQSIFLTVSYYIDKVREKQTTNMNSRDVIKLSKKYLARSLIDLMIFFEKSDMNRYKKLTYPEVISLVKMKELLPSGFFSNLNDASAIIDSLVIIKNLMQKTIDINTNLFELDEYMSTDGLVMPLLLAQDSQKNLIIYIHGNGSASCISRPEFINKLYAGLKISQFDLLAANNRGSNYITQLKKHDGTNVEKVFYGMTYELINECVNDIDGMIAYAKKKGYQKIFLMGHSSGANKVVIYNHLKKNKPKELVGYILCAGGDDIGLRKKMLKNSYQETIKYLEEQIKKGKNRDFVPNDIYPSKHPISYQSLLELIKEDSQYDIFPYYSLDSSKKTVDKFKYLKEIKLDTLVVYGSDDFGCGIPVDSALNKLKARILSDKNNFELDIIQNTDHNFRDKEIELGQLAAGWCKKIGAKVAASHKT
jgi:pimeloyl-ACP methyl ester carboxylesterase/predicted nucleotidyltransferase